MGTFISCKGEFQSRCRYISHERKPISYMTVKSSRGIHKSGDEFSMNFAALTRKGLSELPQVVKIEVKARFQR